jgi:hypothetical protein
MNAENSMVPTNSSKTLSLAPSQNVNLKMEIAAAAMSKMLKNKHFSICSVDDVCKVIGARPAGAAYDMLAALHCVNYADMPQSVLDEIPALLNEVFKQAANIGISVETVFKGVRA